MMDLFLVVCFVSLLGLISMKVGQIGSQVQSKDPSLFYSHELKVDQALKLW